MGIITKNIITGFFTLVPVVLTFYLLLWAIVATEGMLRAMLGEWLPSNVYLPGMGVAMVLAVCFFVGMLMHSYVVRQVFQRAERVFYRLPLIKIIYPAIRDFMDYFSPIKKKEFQQVVSVRMGDNGVQLIGLVTQENMAHMPEGFNDEHCVLVYLPMSYMIGGYVALIPRKYLTPLDISMEAGMRLVLTAGVATLNSSASAHQAKREEAEHRHGDQDDGSVGDGKDPPEAS